MIGNILKVIAALLVGYLVGLLCGGAIGILLGLPLSLFFREIVSSNQTVPTSILLSVILGGLLGFSEVQIFNKLFATSDRPLIGIVAGAIFGLLFGTFGYGVLDVSSSEPFHQRFYTGAMIYSGALGSRIGTVIYSAFGAVTTIREILKPHQEIRKMNWHENKNELP